jgi:hypothetical protein
LGDVAAICCRFDAEVPLNTKYSLKPVVFEGGDQLRSISLGEIAVATGLVAESADVLYVCRLSVVESGESLLAKSNAWTW